MKDKDTPLGLVRAGKGFYDTMDIMKAAKGSHGLDWPNFCDLPVSAVTSLLSKRGADPLICELIAAELTACYTWRKNKVLFAFDKDLSHALAAQADDIKDTDILPTEILLHPPYPCTFVKISNVISGLSGFWYWIDYEIGTGRIGLRFQFVVHDMKYSFPVIFHLLPGKTIRECYNVTVTEFTKHMPLQIIELFRDYFNTELHYILVALQFVLYLSSGNADVQDVPQPASKVRKKPGQILDKASEVKEKAVGVRIGSAIRKATSPSRSSSQGGTGTTVRPHSRRGHWHHYWTGPRNGDRELILRWTAPTFIHMNEFRNDTVVIHPVKQERHAL